jgi:hypothetical protein
MKGKHSKNLERRCHDEKIWKGFECTFYLGNKSCRSCPIVLTRGKLKQRSTRTFMTCNVLDNAITVVQLPILVVIKHVKYSFNFSRPHFFACCSFQQQSKLFLRHTAMLPAVSIQIRQQNILHVVLIVKKKIFFFK